MSFLDARGEKITRQTSRELYFTHISLATTHLCILWLSQQLDLNNLKDNSTDAMPTPEDL